MCRMTVRSVTEKRAPVTGLTADVFHTFIYQVVVIPSLFTLLLGRDGLKLNKTKLDTQKLGAHHSKRVAPFNLRRCNPKRRKNNTKASTKANKTQKLTTLKLPVTR